MKKISIAVCLFCAAAVSASTLSTTPLPKQNDRIQSRFNASKQEAYPIVFMGDSITHGWEGAGKGVYNKYFGDKKILNVATGGDRTENTLWVIDQLDWKTMSPRVVMLMIGTNNTGHRKLDEESPQDTFDGIKAILERIQKKSPGTKVLMLAIFPRDKVSDQTRVRNSQVNAMLPTLCDGKNVVWWDINAKLLSPKDGATLSKDIMNDFLHPGPAGYEIWAEAVKDKLESMSK